MLDYHVHLWPHEQRHEPAELRLERLARYCDEAARHGVREIALTEHLFRFVEVQPIAADIFDQGGDRALTAQMKEYFAHHATASLDQYVEAVLEAKQAGLPVVLGLEVDYYQDRMGQVGNLLA